MSDDVPNRSSKKQTYVTVPFEVAEIVNSVFLPANPRKMRKAHPEVVAAAQAFKVALLKPHSGLTLKHLSDDVPNRSSNHQSYVQEVPDHCDRILWRGRYYHLPLGSSDETSALSGEPRGPIGVYLDHLQNRVWPLEGCDCTACERRRSESGAPIGEEAGDRAGPQVCPPSKWKGYCQCKWDKTSSRVIEMHPACRFHSR